MERVLIFIGLVVGVAITNLLVLFVIALINNRRTKLEGVFYLGITILVETIMMWSLVK